MRARAVPLRLGWALLGALWLCGCNLRELLSPEVISPVEVREVTAEFPSDGRGTFGLELDVKGLGRPGELTGLSWEILLGERWFAAGTRPLSQSLPLDGVTRLSLELPVAFDHRVVPGPVTLDVGVRGYVEGRLGQDERRWRFQARLDVKSAGAPRLGPGGRE
ncbi:MAG TPA: hypothetical protein VK447_00600 [Myxococcaceae bacterium]|nr:hypothetical protein [Myxococcaceae bacterium]